MLSGLARYHWGMPVNEKLSWVVSKIYLSDDSGSLAKNQRNEIEIQFGKGKNKTLKFGKSEFGNPNVYWRGKQLSTAKLVKSLDAAIAERKP